jgi:hypothetical protein
LRQRRAAVKARSKLSMNTRLVLAVAAMLLCPITDAASAATRSRLMPPVSPNTAVRRPGSHYSIEDGELTRRCSDLQSQFDRAVAGTHQANWTRNAVALRDAGVAACNQGSRQEGIEKLQSAVTAIGAVPRLTY